VGYPEQDGGDLCRQHAFRGGVELFAALCRGGDVLTCSVDPERFYCPDACGKLQSPCRSASRKFCRFCGMAVSRGIFSRRLAPRRSMWWSGPKLVCRIFPMLAVPRSVASFLSDILAFVFHPLLRQTGWPTPAIFLWLFFVLFPHPFCVRISNDDGNGIGGHHE
jgi:hypothetical protein